jgi:hypothetical protein
MAISVERHAAEDDRHGFLDAAVGQRQGCVGFLRESLGHGLELGMLAEASGVCYALHDHLLSAHTVLGSVITSAQMGATT